MTSTPSTSRLRLLGGLVLILAVGCAAALWLLRAGGGASSRAVAPESAPAVEPAAPAGESSTPSLERAGLADSEARPARLAPRGPASMRGRVFDERTGAGLARVAVAILSESSLLEVVQTAADGRFETRAAFPRCTVRLAIDRGALPIVGPIEREHRPGEGEVWSIPVRCGPSFELVLHPAGLSTRESLQARLIADFPGGRQGPWRWLPLTERPELAYRHPGPSTLAGGELFVEVRSLDLAWTGRSPVRTDVGPHPGPVHVWMRRLASVTGRVVDSAGAPVEEPEVGLRRIGPAEEEWEHAGGDEQGRFAFSGLEAGPYDLLVRAPERRALEGRIEVVPGAQELGDLVLQALTAAGPVSGQVRLAGADAAFWLSLHLSSVDGGVERTAMSGPREPAAPGEEIVWDFEFEEVPAAAYRLRLFSVPEVDCPSRDQVIAAPLTHLEIRCSAAGGYLALGFRVLERGTRREIPSFDVMVQLTERWVPSPIIAEFAQPCWQAPAGRPLQWIVRAPGHLTARGTLADFQSAGDLHLAEVELERGWSAVILTRDASRITDSYFDGFLEDGMASFTAPAVPGVRLLCDGELAAATDRRGLAILERPSEPASIEAELAGWKFFGSDELEGGRLTGDRSPAVIWMRRE